MLSAGYICPKGVALKDLHEDPDRLRAPLAVFVGQSVTGKSQDVVQVLAFLARFASEKVFAQKLLRQVLDASNPIQQALFAARLTRSAWEDLNDQRR